MTDAANTSCFLERARREIPAVGVHGAPMSPQHHSRDSAFSPRESLDLAMVRVAEEACSHWPTLAITPEQLVELWTRWIPQEPHPHQTLERMHAKDLCLAAACLNQDPCALAELDRSVVEVGLTAARRILKDARVADEVAQRVRERILLRSDDRPRIANYRGQGSLKRWLLVVALRVALDVLDSRRHEPMCEDQSLGELLVADGEDPELRFAYAHHRMDFNDAFRTGVQALTPSERTVLKLYFLDQLSLEAVGRILGVHHTTVSRRLAVACKTVRACAHRVLAERLHLSPSQVDSMMRLAQAQMDLSLGRFLRELVNEAPCAGVSA